MTMAPRSRTRKNKRGQERAESPSRPGPSASTSNSPPVRRAPNRKRKAEETEDEPESHPMGPPSKRQRPPLADDDLMVWRSNVKVNEGAKTGAGVANTPQTPLGPPRPGPSASSSNTPPVRRAPNRKRKAEETEDEPESHPMGPPSKRQRPPLADEDERTQRPDVNEGAKTGAGVANTPQTPLGPPRPGPSASSSNSPPVRRAPNRKRKAEETEDEPKSHPMGPPSKRQRPPLADDDLTVWRSNVNVNEGAKTGAGVANTPQTPLGPPRPGPSASSSNSPPVRRAPNRKRKAEETEDEPENKPTKLFRVTWADQALVRDDTYTRSKRALNKKEFGKKYEMGAFLQRGAFGRVLSGVRRVDNKPMAIKIIRKENIAGINTENIDKIQDIPEISALLRLGEGTAESDSVPCVRLLDCYDWGTEVAIVMERPENCEDLKKYRDCVGRIQPETVKAIFRELVDGAIFMDSRGILHCDIKPSNVLVEKETETPRVWYIDFGCAKTFTPGETFSSIAGHRDHFPPEFCRFDPISPEPATVWQLGLMLYSMLFGKLHRRLPMTKGCSPDLRDLLKGCLDQDPDLRLKLEEVKNHPWLRS